MRIAVAFFGVAITMLGGVGGSCIANRGSQIENAMLQETDRDLIEVVASTEPEAAFRAAKELYRRGERVIPLLVELEGRCEIFRGAPWLVQPRSSQLVLTTEEGGCASEEAVSLQVAALFLIQAIYSAKLDFAQSPYLTDSDDAAASHSAANTGDRVKRAWDSVRPWVKELTHHGLTRLQARKHGPLDESGVVFW